MSPAQRDETVQRMRAERDWTRQDIEQRLAELDALSKSPDVSPDVKADALRRFQKLSKLLERRAREELGSHLDRADRASEAITALRTEGSAIPKDSEEHRAQRRQKAAEIRARRREQEAAVKQAETVVAAAEASTPGLKEERLALSEHILDPNAPKEGSGQTLAEMIERYLRLDHFVERVVPAVTAAFDVMHEAAVREYEIDQAAYAEKDRVHLQQETDHARRLDDRSRDAARTAAAQDEARLDELRERLRRLVEKGVVDAPVPT